MKTLNVFIFSLLMIFYSAYAGEYAGGEGGAFLRIPVGARPAGLGNAFVAIADDGSAPFYNPAGLSQIQGSRISAMYNFMSLDRMNYQASFIMSTPIDVHVALTFNNFSVSDIIECLPGENPSGEIFSDNAIALGLFASYKIIPLVSIGAGTKYIIHSIHDKSASGLDFDAGAMIRKPVSIGPITMIRGGISIQNVGGEIKWNTDSDHKDKITPSIRIGVSSDIQLTSFDMICSAEISQCLGRKNDEYKNFKFHIGVEVWFSNLLAIRSGLEGKDFRMGASLMWSDFRFDYAYTPDHVDEGTTHKLSVEIGF